MAYRVLIADDEEMIADSMRDVLESVGHHVTVVTNGAEALESFETGEFDVALVDVMMPKLDGYHVAQAVHKLKNPPKVVIVTARNFETDRAFLQASGADAFLHKPFSNRDLLEVVNNMAELRQRIKKHD